jgi:hypothetical protein
MTAPTQAPPKKAGAAPPKAQQIQARSFLIGTQEVIEGQDYDQSVNAAGTNFPNWSISATGWLKGIWLHILITVAANAVATVVAAENYPFNILGNIQLNDINNEAIFGPFDSYTAMLINKYGGYYNVADPATAATYYRVALTGTNAAAGSSQILLWIPLEIVRRDPIGPVASVNNTAALTLVMATNSSANLFTTPPTTFPTVRVRATQVFYWEPKATDRQGRPIQGKPLASGTTQYWTQGNLALTGGTNNQQLPTGLGYPWRSYLMMLVRSAGTRANGELDWPDPLIGLKFEANMLVSQYQKALWNAQMAMDYGYGNTNLQQTTPADVRLADVAAVGTQATWLMAGNETGVKVLNWNKDFAFNKPGSETRRTYLVTAAGSNFIFNGAVGNAGTLYSIINYVAPPAGDRSNTYALTGGR